MISWISNLIQKRGKIIFSVLLFIIIIAFVFTIGAGPGIVSSDKTNYQREFYGIDLNSTADIQVLQNTTMVSRYINGMRQYDESQFQQQMLVRQVRIFLADELSIPEPTEDALKTFIKSKRSFQNETGQFEKALFQGFVTSLKGGSQINEGFVSRTLKEDYRLEQLDRLMTGPGMISEKEVISSVAREKTTWDLEIVKTDYTDFNPTIEAAEENVAEYFGRNQFRYEIPKEYTISFVEFSAANITEAVEDPGEEELQRYFLTHRSKFENAEKAITPEVEDAEVLSPLDVFEELKDDVFNAYATDQKTGQAVVLANDFTGTIFDNEIPYQSLEFKKLLLEYGLKLKSIPPFTINTSTQLIGLVPAALYENAMVLDDSRYFTDVIAHRDGDKFLVGFLEAQTEARIPQLDEVRTLVVRDYKSEQKTALFSEHGISLATTFREKLQSGETFIQLAEAEALAYEKPESFLLTEKPESIPFQLLQSIEELKSGELTDMITIEGTGYFVLVNEKAVPEISEEDPRYISMFEGLSNYSAVMRYQALIDDMISKKLNPET